MTDERTGGPGVRVRPGDVRQAGDWLARHGLGEARPTPLLAARLAARRRARLADHLMLAVLIIAAALAQLNLFLAAPGGPGSESWTWWPLLMLAGLVAALLVTRTLLEAWVRRIDRGAGAALARRAAHPVQPGWRALLGRPYALWTAGTYAAALALAGSALTLDGAGVRQAALVLLVALAGVGAVALLQVRDLLARPVVAEDELSLTADVIMRIEDARESTSPGTVWCLPMVLLFGTAPGWWRAASLSLVLLGLAALVVIQTRTPDSAAMARRIVSLG
ncbi:hypothetical protein ACBR40_03215 [Nonomuraea sp. AD125B]|uniref:hypothetical protein n=1 Tax=Nonomuraea sp. AD125B TaxID=3242897 RepID=UPI003527C7A5